MSFNTNCPHCHASVQPPPGASEFICPACKKSIKKAPDGHTAEAQGKGGKSLAESRFVDPDELKEMPFPVDDLAREKQFQEALLQGDPFSDLDESYRYVDEEALAQIPEPPADAVPDHRDPHAEEAVPERHPGEVLTHPKDIAPTMPVRPRRAAPGESDGPPARDAAATHGPGGRMPAGQIAFDPARPAEYMRSLGQLAHLDESTRSCLGEALQTYRAGCFKAAAVLLGVATERMYLDLRHSFLTCFRQKNDIPMDQSGKARVVWRQMAQTIYTQLKAAARKSPEHGKDWDRLARALDARVDAFSYLLRLGRDESYRPASFEFVTPGEVHAALALLPSLADLLHRLRYWMHKNLLPAPSPTPAAASH